MSDAGEQRPKTQPAFPGRPPNPPKQTARGLEDSGDHPGRTVYVLEQMLVKDLAVVLGLKPHTVVADLMELKLFKSPQDGVDFETAAAVARKHGFRAQRPPPGALVL